MVSNVERIFREIQKESDRVAPHHGLEPESVVNLIMKIVDLEDQHRIKSVARMHQKVREMIQDVPVAKGTRGDA